MVVVRNTIVFDFPDNAGIESMIRQLPHQAGFVAGPTSVFTDQKSFIAAKCGVVDAIIRRNISNNKNSTIF
jgi:hypothetical protein